jgi:hypothetical protein
LSGIFPDRLKLFIIKPLYKKGDKLNAANYRPISLLILFSKVFENAMYIRLIEHLNIKKILVKQQFGFRKNSATEDAICKLTNKILNYLNNKIMVGSISCNLENLLTLLFRKYY